MKRFLLFGTHSGVKSGGWRDLAGSYDTAGQAIKVAKQFGFVWWHVVDLNLGYVVQTHKS